MSKRRNLKKEKQERNRAYARKFKKRKLRTDGRPDGMGNVTGTANNGGAADQNKFPLIYKLFMLSEA